MAVDSGIVVLSFVIGLLVVALVWSLTRKSEQKGKGEKSSGSKTKEAKKN